MNPHIKALMDAAQTQIDAMEPKERIATLAVFALADRVFAFFDGAQAALEKIADKKTEITIHNAGHPGSAGSASDLRTR